MFSGFDCRLSDNVGMMMTPDAMTNEAVSPRSPPFQVCHQSAAQMSVSVVPGLKISERCRASVAEASPRILPLLEAFPCQRLVEADSWRGVLNLMEEYSSDNDVKLQYTTVISVVARDLHLIR